MFYFYNKLIYLFDCLFCFSKNVLISYVILEMLSRKPSRGVREWFGAKQNADSRENINMLKNNIFKLSFIYINLNYFK